MKAAGYLALGAPRPSSIPLPKSPNIGLNAWPLSPNLFLMIQDQEVPPMHQTMNHRPAPEQEEVYLRSAGCVDCLTAGQNLEAGPFPGNPQGQRGLPDPSAFLQSLHSLGLLKNPATFCKM